MPVTDDLAGAIAAARAPKSCPSCGRTFGSPSAWQLAHDGRCLPDHFFEAQLTRVDGVYVLRGSVTSGESTAVTDS
jgi:hypothetical protein